MNIEERRQRTWQLVAIIVALLVGVRACATDENFKAQPPPPDDLGAICSYDAECSYFCTLGLHGMAPFCTRNCTAEAPCPDGYVCVAEGQMGMVCAMGSCSGDAECPAGYTCNTEDSVCQHGAITCGNDNECPAASACNQGTCVTVCQSEDDCKQGYLCDYNSRCVRCVNNSHCENGYACSGGNCNTACIEDANCRSGFECVDAACQQIVGGGPGLLGDSCSEDAECADFCANQYCSQVCDPSDAQSCPDGYRCHESHMYCSSAN